MKKNPTGQIAALIGAAASLIAVLTWLGVRPPDVHKVAPRKAQAKTARKPTKAAASHSQQPAKPREQVVDGSVSPVAGAWQYHGGTVSAGGKVFEGYGTLSEGTRFATFDVKGWDTFTVSIGMNDNHPTPAPEFDAAIEVDGHSLQRYRVEDGTRPETLEITLRGARAVTLRCERYTGELSDLLFAEPKLRGK